MAKGVKTIQMTKGLYYSMTTTNVTIKPDQEVQFEVLEWLPNTTEEEKQENIYWLRQSNDRKTIIYKGSGALYTFTLPKKLCGSYTFYIEASRSGNRDFKNPSGMYLNGYTPARIKSSEWRSQPQGSDIRHSPIAYGDLVYLWLNTEGLNGDTITIEIYNMVSMKEDDLIVTKKNVKVRDGEALYTIGDTNMWMGMVKRRDPVEKFYIKVKNAKGNYILDHIEDEEHARFLEIKNELSSNQVKPSENLTPTKIYEPEVNAERFEPCKFDEIIITAPTVKDGKTETKPVTVFKKGQALKGKKATSEKINRVIYYKFNDYSISPEAQKTLNNILGFLLEHKGTTIHMSGYACVIGKEDYNKELSQKRGDAVKDFFVQGGLDADRIISTGRGEYNIQSPDDYKNRNEKVYKNARRVDISFTFAGHDANAVVYNTIAPSSPKHITLDVVGLEVDDCYRDAEKHTKDIIVKSPDAKPFKGSGKSIRFPIQSTLSAANPAPLQYIWPKWNLIEGVANGRLDAAAVYEVYVNTCRYYSNKKNPVLKVKAYPDIKWELAFEFLVNVSNYKATNMPSGSVFARHQEKSREAGYNRWLMNKQGKVPISIGVGLGAEWDNGNEKRSFTNEFSKKMEALAKIIARSIDVVQNAINFAQSAAKKTAIPIGFDVRYPKFTVVGSWLLEQSNEDVVVAGTVGFGFKPLIGAEVIIDIIGAAITAVSYGTTGNPAAARLISKFRGGLEKLGATVVFTATFYGELEIMVDALKIDSKNGIDMQGKTTISGKMGVIIELSISTEIGKTNSMIIRPISISFKASAKAHGYFGGDFIIDTDKKGMFIKPVLKFSGVMLSVEIEGELGWWKSSFKLEERIIEEESYTMQKRYITEN
ncbi:OmpA family protein [Aquimarina longa]|uniref:OmpA family protein n=1 Tax=Aquimarina longa TaxID=1080221 RepID=UPI0007854692|nr:OmpA family protein [Aquimarina longa]